MVGIYATVAPILYLRYPGGQRRQQSLYVIEQHVSLIDVVLSVSMHDMISKRVLQWLYLLERWVVKLLVVLPRFPTPHLRKLFINRILKGIEYIAPLRIFNWRIFDFSGAFLSGQSLDSKM
jgi:hypothetical protein